MMAAPRPVFKRGAARIYAKQRAGKLACYGRQGIPWARRHRRSAGPRRTTSAPAAIVGLRPHAPGRLVALATARFPARCYKSSSRISSSRSRFCFGSMFSASSRFSLPPAPADVRSTDIIVVAERTETQSSTA